MAKIEGPSWMGSTPMGTNEWHGVKKIGNASRVLTSSSQRTKEERAEGEKKGARLEERRGNERQKTNGAHGNVKLKE